MSNQSTLTGTARETESTVQMRREWKRPEVIVSVVCEETETSPVNAGADSGFS